MLAVAHRSWSGTGRGNLELVLFYETVHHHLWCLMRIEFLTSLGIPTPKRKMPPWPSFFMMRQYVVKMSSELVPYLQTSTACVLLFSPRSLLIFFGVFPVFDPAPPCSICIEVAQVGGRWRGRKCEHTPPPHVWFVHLALDLSPLAHHFASLTFRQRSHKRNQQHVSLSRDAAFWSFYIFLR